MSTAPPVAAVSHEDRNAIRRLKHEYCFAIDSGRYEEWASLFTEDGRFVRGSGDAYEGRDELYAFASEEFDPIFETFAHIVTNPVIDGDGDRATGRWYLFMPYQEHGGGTGWIHAKYDDTYRRVDGEWRIAESVVENRIPG